MKKSAVNIPKVPNLRFPGFVGEWEVNTLGEVGEIINGLTYSPNEIDKNGVLVLRSSNIQNRTITFGDNVFVKTNNFNAVLENDILICVRNGSKNLIGKNAIVKKDQEGYAFGAFMTVYRSFHNKFLFHWFDTKYYKSEVYKNLGATINSINGSDLKKFKIPFPSVAEQNRIASFLYLIDERIHAFSKIIEELKLLKDGLIKKIFSLQYRFKDNNGNNYLDWEIKKLGDIGETYNGLTGKTKENFGTGKPFIQYKQIFDHSKIDISKCDFVSITSNEKQNQVKKGDVFFTVSSETPEEIGMSSVLLDEVEEAYLNSFCFGYRPHSFESLYPSFARHLFRSNVFRNEIIKLAQGSTRYNLSKIALMKLGINIPSIQEQIKIADFFSMLDNKNSIEQCLLKQLEIQKKYLLQNLFI